MKKLGVIFGGRTVEHDVSIVTGCQVMENADKKKYDVVPIYISREGEWFTGEKLKDAGYYINFSRDDRELTRVYMTPEPGSALMAYGKGGLFGGGAKEYCRLDAVIPAMHGMHGEDGTLQGLFELAAVPYANSGVLGSSVGMDKIVMKSVFRGCGFPVVESCFFTREEWETARDAVIKKVEELPYPVFVKPANLGSSIGISKAKDRASLLSAIEVALSYDRRVLVERGVENLMEINCSCLGVGGQVQASVCEQPVSWEEFLSFDDKYIRGKSKGKSGGDTARRIPAPISDELADEIRNLSVEVFRALDCRGVVRIDYIYDNAAGRLYVNEINTIPGSFAFYLWEPVGISFSRLIDMLVEDAEYACGQKQRNSYAYDSKLLEKVKARGAQGVKK